MSKNIAKTIGSDVLGRLVDAGVEVRADSQLSNVQGTLLANEDDWGTEYLDMIIAAKVVDGVDEAIEHIRIYGSQHTDCILTEDQKTADHFMQRLDSAILMHNTSTQFADGGEFGFGGEVGISTNTLPPRGPVGLGQLISYKYEIVSNGKIRR